MSYNLTTLETGLTPDRLANIIAYSHSCSDMPGCFAEFGVMKGGCLELLAKLHPNRVIYGIDGFEGLPEPTKYDVHPKGDFALSFKDLDAIHKTFKKSNVKVLKGYSPDVFLLNDIFDESFAFVHVDVDLYPSVKDALDFFWPRLLNGGIMIFDDYGFPTTPGAKKAIDEFNQPVRRRMELGFEGWKTGQYMIIK